MGDLVCSPEVVRDGGWRQSSILCECEFCLCVTGSVAHFTVAVPGTIDSIPGPWPLRPLSGQPFDLSVFVKQEGEGLRFHFCSMLCKSQQNTYIVRNVK